MSEMRSIEAEINVPDLVEVPKGAESVTLDARVTLRNAGEDDLVVQAPSRDHRHFWQVFDGNHREVLRERRSAPGRAKVQVDDGVHSYVSETIAAGHEEHATRRLELNARKLRQGDVYTVRAEFFGHLAEARFSVVKVPAVPARKTAKAAKKKTARKKTVKRAPKKKAAKKAGKKTGRKAR